MADELCMHEMDPATCSICKRGTTRKPTQVSLNFGAIEEAVNDLASTDLDFTTKQVAHHAAVTRAHGTLCDDPRFDQQVGSYLTGAVGRLKITQVSPKGQSNARWHRR